MWEDFLVKEQNINGEVVTQKFQEYAILVGGC